MITKLRGKIRALVEDIALSDFDYFEIEDTNVLELDGENISSITKVTKNGTELGSGDYEYDSDFNTITITDGSSGDKITVYYNYNKYSNTKIDGYINSALVYLSIYNYRDRDFEIEDGAIFPTPDNNTVDLIAIVASILMKPNYSEYRMPGLTVKYPRTLTKEKRIAKIVNRFRKSLGVNSTIEWEEDDYYGEI